MIIKKTFCQEPCFLVNTNRQESVFNKDKNMLAL